MKKQTKYPEVLLKLLEDYTYLSKLTKELYPRSKEKDLEDGTGFIVSQKVRVPFVDFGKKSSGKRGNKDYKNYEKKPITSIDGIRNKNEKYSKSNQPAYRLKLSEYLNNYSSLKFSIRTKKIFEIMFYAREIRKDCFNKKSFEKLNDIDLIFSIYLKNEFIINAIRQFINYESSSRTGAINFDKTAKKFYNKKVEELNFSEIESIARDIYTATARGGREGIRNPTWLERFADEEFFFDVLKGLKDLILVKFLINEIFLKQIKLEKNIEDFLKKNYITKKEFQEDPDYNGKVIYDWIGIQDEKTFYDNYLTSLFLKFIAGKLKLKNPPQEIKDSRKLYKRLGELEEKLKKIRNEIEGSERYLSIMGENFIPKIEEWIYKKYKTCDGKDAYTEDKLIKPKLCYHKSKTKTNPLYESSDLISELNTLVN